MKTSDFQEKNFHFKTLQIFQADSWPMDLILFLILTAGGTLSSYFSVNVPGTEFFLEGRYIFGFIGFAILRRWPYTLLLACILALVGFHKIPLHMAFIGNLFYSIPNLILIRFSYHKYLRKINQAEIFALFWLLLMFICYQVTNVCIAVFLSCYKKQPVLDEIINFLRTQPLLVEGIIVAFITASLMMILRSNTALLRKTEELTHAQRIGKIGSWQYDPQKKLIYGSEETARICGFKKNHWSFDDMREKVKLDDREYTGLAIQNYLQNKQNMNIVLRLQISIEAKPKHVHLIGVFNKEKKRFSGTIQDISARIEAEESLAAEKERLAVTLRSIGDGVITTDTKGRILIINQVAEKLTGWTQEEAIGKELKDVFCIIDKESGQVRPNPVNKVLSQGEIIELEEKTLLVAKDGQSTLISDSAAPIRNPKSEIIGVVLVFRDNSEKYRLMEKIQQTDKLDSLGVLAGGIAHDFNNLLGGLFGYIDIAREYSPNSKTKDYLDKAMEVFHRTKDLTQQLLTFARGGNPLKKTADLAPIIRKTASFILSGSNIKSNYQISQDLLLCDFDENQISQVLDNLIINAQQAMPMGGEINISAENCLAPYKNTLLNPNLAYIKISICDTGTGIQEKYLKKIFDPFFTTKAKGTGLGLTSCFSIIQKHKGIMDVESQPGQGSCFYIYLPASSKKENQLIPKESRQHQGEGNILIMDDEEYVLDVAQAILSQMGYTVFTAKNGEEALSIFSREKDKGFKAIILDLTIPGEKGGKETIKDLLALDPELKVFASSGYSEDPVMAYPKEFGFVDSLRKPYRIKELSAFLEKHFPAK